MNSMGYAMTTEQDRRVACSALTMAKCLSFNGVFFLAYFTFRFVSRPLSSACASADRPEPETMWVIPKDGPKACFQGTVPCALAGVKFSKGGTVMPSIMRSRLQKAIYLAIVVLCSTCLIAGCQTVPTKMNSGRLLEIATAEKDSERCRDYDFQVVVNGQKGVIRGKACARSK